MIVTALTGEYDDALEYTAWELAADWWWNELGYDAVPVGGRSRYETATIGEGRLVRLWRLDTSDGLKEVYRYVGADTRFTLRKEDE